MQGNRKVIIDLFFCFIVGFIIIQSSNSAGYNETLSNNLFLESARITTENF